MSAGRGNGSRLDAGTNAGRENGSGPDAGTNAGRENGRALDQRPGELADDEAHLAALLAVLSLARAGEVADGTPLQRWRARRLAALSSSARTSDRPARPR